MIRFKQAELEAAITQLHDSPQMVYLACTGAGAGVTKLLWSVPGCSRTLIGSEFPYHPRAFAIFIGRTPEHYSSADAAIALATAGYLKAQRCLVEQGKLSTPIIGLGLAAAVATDRVRRGEDKLFLAIRTLEELATVSVIFERGFFSRGDEGDLSDVLAINCLLWAAGIEQVPVSGEHLRSSELTAAGQLQPARVTVELDTSPLPLLFDEDGRSADLSLLSPARHILFPGSFNPLHFGHDLFAQAVSAMTGKQIVFEITAVNADKPGIGREVLARRALQFRGRWPVLLSENLPLFIQKARAYGGYGFIVGLDTAIRLFDAKYFGSEADRDAVVAEFRDLGTTFYVCNRGDDPSEFARVVRDPRFADLFVPVTMVVPVRSSDLRAGASGAC